MLPFKPWLCSCEERRCISNFLSTRNCQHNLLAGARTAEKRTKGRACGGGGEEKKTNPCLVSGTVRLSPRGWVRADVELGGEGSPGGGRDSTSRWWEMPALSCPCPPVPSSHRAQGCPSSPFPIPSPARATGDAGKIKH